MSNDERVRQEIIRVASNIDKILETDEIKVDNMVLFSNNVFNQIDGIVLRGAVSAYNALVGSDMFKKASSQEKTKCLNNYRRMLLSMID